MRESNQHAIRESNQHAIRESNQHAMREGNQHAIRGQPTFPKDSAFSANLYKSTPDEEGNQHALRETISIHSALTRPRAHRKGTSRLTREAISTLWHTPKGNQSAVAE